MTIIAVAGFSVAAAGYAFHRFGGSPLARSMLIPLMVLGLFFAAMGVSGHVSNQRRLVSLERAHQQDPVKFLQAEKARVAGFQYMYKITNVVAPLCFLVAAAIFWSTLNPSMRALAITLVLFGLFGFLVDGFSKERADAYYARLLELEAAMPA